VNPIAKRRNFLIPKRHIYQQSHNWYVLDEDFTWNVTLLRSRIFSLLDNPHCLSIPVVFCDSCEANKIVSELGEEECEWLLYASGVYWREVGIIFIFRFDEYLSLVETLFHEFRHIIQEHTPSLRSHFESDKFLPYEERVTEKDAFSFASEHLQLYIQKYSDASLIL